MNVPARTFEAEGRRALRLGVLAMLLALACVAPAAQAAEWNRAQLASLAWHLRASGARLHGVWWCPDCRTQKEMFAEAAVLLPYVEAGSAGADTSVHAYPTWVIRGVRVSGVLPPDSLAARSGYTGGRFSWAKPRPPAGVR